MSKRLIFLGPPGAGKGTQAERLAASAEIPHISTGEILRQAITDGTALGQQAQAFMDKGELVPDSLLVDLVRERLQQPDAASGWILDGFPRTVAQAEFLDQLLTELQQTPITILNLEVPKEILVERLLARKRKDDTADTIRRRLVVYQEQTKPIVEFYSDRQVHHINGDRTPEAVEQALRELIST
ncbi:MAG: adenylate kinase [Cyanobacteria bacterium P01_G01_bin.54]